MPKFTKDTPTALHNLAEDKQREIAKKGGKIRQKKRKERVLLSQIYAEFLASDHEVKIGGEIKKMSSQEYLGSVIRTILQTKGDNSSKVKMLDLIVKATEGIKIEANLENHNQELITDLKSIFSNEAEERTINDFIENEK